MARQPRLALPDVALHIIQRGNNRGMCFSGDTDYLCYLAYLRRFSQKYRCMVHAYCLMTNHVHILATPSESDSCTSFMRDLGQSYVKYFNRRHRRTGTLWEGRYRSCVVESSTYVLACYRYIELNPVRAGMVHHPSAYAWSSYAVNAGFSCDDLVTPHSEYLAIAANPNRRSIDYRRLLDDGLDEVTTTAIRDATNSSLPLCSDAFKADLQAGGRKVGHLRPGPQPAAVKAADALQLKIVL